ncbi:MAG: hypothetical protein J6K83_06590, partial [Bacteroidaceae bacterium]|nr:hypothetical protein [Bacteroidaceae bacterium]
EGVYKYCNKKTTSLIVPIRTEETKNSLPLRVLPLQEGELKNTTKTAPMEWRNLKTKHINQTHNEISLFSSVQ